MNRDTDSSDRRSPPERAVPVPGSPVYRRNQLEQCDDLVVAVHGMGDQTRNDFAQNIAELFANYAISQGAPKHQTTRLPLGVWDGGGASSADDDAIGFVPASDEAGWLNPLAFAEVHWADLPRDLEKEGYRLEESTHWAASVVGRLSQRHGLAGQDGKGEDGPRLAATVVEEVGETLRILSQLMALAEKAGIFRFDLANILVKYLSDVQQVAEFRGQRGGFLRAFLRRMSALHIKCPRANLHIIAHSEGSVLALLGLLTALREESKCFMRGFDFSWLDKVVSFSTLGSPIDKHLILWPEMWYQFRPTESVGGRRHITTWRALEQRIRWRNYYDLADPVGFSLDTARDQLKAWKCEAFEFEPTTETSQHDFGFRRYPFPGKAHIDYFADVELFGFIIRDAIGIPAANTPPEGDQEKEEKKKSDNAPGNTFCGRWSPVIPFLLVILLHIGAVFVLYRSIGVDDVLHAAETERFSEVAEELHAFYEAAEPTGDTTKNPELHEELSGAFTRESLLGILGCAALLLATTILARMFRLTKDKVARGWAIFWWLLGVSLFCWIPGLYVFTVAGNAYQVAEALHIDRMLDSFAYNTNLTPRMAAIAMFILVSLFIVAASRFWDNHALKHQKRPILGLRWMMILGALPLTLLLIFPRIGDNADTSALVLLGGGAAFFYLWWLGILLFDLSYVWKRYINTKNNDDTILGKIRPRMRTPDPDALSSGNPEEKPGTIPIDA